MLSDIQGIGKVFLDELVSIMSSKLTADALLIELFSPVISYEENVFVIAPPSSDEIHNIIKSLIMWKAPGPDKFDGQFF